VTFTEQRDDTTGDVTLDFVAQAGPLVAIAAVRVSGTGRTEPGFVRDRVALKPGDTWNTPEERDSYSTLHRSGLFKRVHIALQPAEPAEVAAAGTRRRGRAARWRRGGGGPAAASSSWSQHGSYEGPRWSATATATSREGSPPHRGRCPAR
jgi:hypothetical protein